ncbi:MAG: PLDc N-terminal domain-containing protein [Desulfurococcales archaeon]|nr:PLDc N-terminal domain-containing protein [Desulfurococcales archaeon]
MISLTIAQGAGIVAGIIGLYLLLLIIAILIAIWVYKDAKKRYPPESSTPVVWLLVVLLTGLIGLIIYLIVRPKEEHRPPQTSTM